MCRSLLVLLLAAACARPTPAVRVALASAARSATPTSAAPAPVGLTSFDAAPAAAIAKNDRGVALLARGKPTDAIAELEAALAISPDFVRARYNLACAYARVGDFDHARAALEAVYEADFVAIREHADQDDDLSAFWKSPQGAALAARKPDYEARFAAAIRRGVPATIWIDGAGPRGARKPSVLRVGVFDATTSRFVAIAPPVKGAIFGYASSRLPYAVVATGTVADFLGGDLDAGMTLDAVHVFPIATSGVETTTLRAPSVPYFGELTMGPTGIRLQVHQPAGPFDGPSGTAYDAIFDAPFGGATQRALFASSAKVPPRPRDHIVSMDIGYNHWGYVVTEDDRSYVYAPKTHELTLPSRRVVAIPKALAFYEAPARVVASPSGDRVVLLWNAAVLECKHDENIPGRYEMALVDTKTGAVTSLGEGDGAGAAAFDASGELYVQRGKSVVLLSRVGPMPLPAHVLLVPALERDDQCGF